MSAQVLRTPSLSLPPGHYPVLSARNPVAGEAWDTS